VRIVLGGLHEELLAVSLMVLAARSFGAERCRDTLRMGHLQGTIHFVGRDMVETLALVSLRKALPISLGSLEQRQCTHHIGMGKGEWILDTTIHVALGSKMNDAIDMLILHQLQESVEVADVHLHKLIVGLVFYVLEVGEITCVSQLVEVDDIILRILVHEKANNMGANEACTPRNNYCFH